MTEIDGSGYTCGSGDAPAEAVTVTGYGTLVITGDQGNLVEVAGVDFGRARA